MTETPPDPPQAPALDLERAEFQQSAAGNVECGACKRPITTEYWQFIGKVLCTTCREGVRATAAQARTNGAFARAFGLAGVVALGCGIGYAIFVGITNIQFALVTIGIGWAVGRTIQKVTLGFGDRRYQILAVALTYFATTMGHVGAVVRASHDSSEQAPTQAAPATPSGSALPSSSAAQGPSLGDAIGALFRAVGLLLLYMLASPFLGISSGIGGVLGILIIFFGLQTAWRVAKGVEGSMTGPHRATAS